MQKILSLLVQTFLFSGASLTITACHNPLTRSDGSENKLPDSIIKNIKYYQDLIKQNQLYIGDCDQMLQEIKDNKDGYDDKKDYQSAVDEVTAQKHNYQAEINEYQYQILLLEREEGENFKPTQILQGITIFTEKIRNLAQELKLKLKYPDYYSNLELQAIEEAINLAQEKLEMFIKLKEEKNVTINFSSTIFVSRC